MTQDTNNIPDLQSPFEQLMYRLEIISVSREEKILSYSPEWDKSYYFTPSNLLPTLVVKMKLHLTSEQTYGFCSDTYNNDRQRKRIC